MSDKQPATELSPEAAREIVHQLVDEVRITNLDALIRQLSSLLPTDGPAAVFETHGRWRRFALVLHKERNEHVVHRVEVQVRGPEDERFAVLRISREPIDPSACWVRMESECVRQRTGPLVRGQQEEMWVRERSWTIQVPEAEDTMTFATEELLAKRTTRVNRQPQESWTLVEPVETELDPRERFARGLAEALGWSAPSTDRGRKDLVQELRD